MRRHTVPRHRRPAGSVLVLAIAVLIVLTSLVLVTARTVRAEAAASANYLAQLQAEAAARGAAEYLRATLADTNGTLPDDTSLHARAQRVGAGYFWLLKRDMNSDTTRAYGLTDEAGKINLNAASADTLSRLPNMTPELAAGVVDWRDPDDTPLDGGAESQYYLMQPGAYNAKNAPFETLDELLLVKDFTPTLLYGNDTNRSGVLDAGDTQTSSLTQLDHGLADLLTVYSVEPNTDSSGQARVNLNDPRQRPQLQQVLQPINAPLPPPNRVFSSVVDYYYFSALPIDQFRKVVDKLTTSGSNTLTGLVNLKTAPRDVLLALPQMTDSDASAIASRRESGGLTDLLSLTEALPRERAIQIASMVTLRSYRCSADIVSCDATGRAFRRYRAVFDARSTPVKVIYWRDVTALGWPLEPGILTRLRAGQAIEAAGMGGEDSVSMGGI